MVSVFQAIPAADPAHYVRGQHDGYREIEGVASDSTTETYAALQLHVDNWRWSGVPFFIRTGKNMPVTVTELRLVFKHPPRLGFLPEGTRRPEPDQLIVRLYPTTGIRLLVEAQRGDVEEPEQVSLDLEFSEQGGEGATPYEVLLHAAMIGDSRRFKRQDSVEETWRIMQPLLDAPPPVHAYEKGSWGPSAGGRPRRRARPLARAVGVGMSATTEAMPQSAAAPSPFPPIADYAFLSTATRARSWPRTARSTGCACRASTRPACSALCSIARPARSGWGRSGSTCPRPASTSRGRTSSATTWKTPTGWVLVRDALTMGPQHGEDLITPHTRPPVDDDADHMLVRTVLCLDGNVEVELVCEPDFDYGRAPADWSLVGDDRHTADARAGELTIRLQTDLALGIEGDRVRARHQLEQGDQAFCALSWAEGLVVPQDRRRGERASRGDGPLLAPLARQRPAPRPPLARPDPALGAHDQGSDLHADRRNGGGGHDIAPRDARRRAQLGLPLHVDPGLDVHAAGAPLPEPRLGGRRVHAVRGRPRAERRRRPSDHVRDRRTPRPHRVHARRAHGVRGRASGAARQRRLRPEAERRLRRGARLDPAARAPQPAPAEAAVADRRGAGEVRNGRVAATRTRASGRPAASLSTTSRRS